MRLSLYLRGIDLVDLEFHAGSKGLFVDLSLFQPRAEEQVPDEGRKATTADLSGTAGMHSERADGPVWQDDQPVIVHAFGFGASSKQEGEAT